MVSTLQDTVNDSAYEFKLSVEHRVTERDMQIGRHLQVAVMEVAAMRSSVSGSSVYWSRR